MIATHDQRFLAPAWGISVALHSTAVGLALLLSAQVKPLIQEDIFTWDVAFVEPVHSQPSSEPVAPVVKSVKSAPPIAAAQLVEPPSDMVTTPVAPRHVVQMVHPVVEPVKPVEQKIEQLQPKVEPVPQKVVEVEQPKVESVVQTVAVAETKEPEPVKHAEPVAAQNHPVVAAAVSEPADVSPQHRVAAEAAAVPSYHETVAHQTPTHETHHESHPAGAHETARTAQEAVVAAPPSGGSAVAEAPVLVAKAVVPGANTKGDHTWLAESLYRRVAELRRYPASARLNGQEGRVVLKAVIRSDGHLADVSVQKSSGYSVLDAAAMEAVRLACPLHMKHAIGKPQIVVSLPIVYSLAN